MDGSTKRGLSFSLLLPAALGFSALVFLSAYADAGEQFGQLSQEARDAEAEAGRPVQVVASRTWWGKKTAPKTHKPPVRDTTPDTASGTTRVTATYLVGAGTAGNLVLEKILPTYGVVGQPFDYQIKVTNLTGLAVEEVVVTDTVPANYRTQTVTPKPTTTAARAMQWALGTLKPRESKTITIKGVASATGVLSNCAELDFKRPLCAALRIVEPKLKLEQSAPQEVLLCDLIPIKYTVTNPGTGYARDTKVTAQLPAGLQTVEGKSSVVFDAGTLGASESKSFVVNAKASKTGQYVAKSTAAAEALKAESNVTKTVVVQPILAIEQNCPKKIFLGRNITSTVKVSNNGSATCSNTVLEVMVPANATFLSASDNGVHSSGRVVWSLGSLKARASKAVSLKVAPTGITTVQLKSTVKGICAEAQTDSCQTEVLGIAAILLEVIDISDPVEVGQNETYVITATNQGTADDTNVKIVCTLEDMAQFVSCEGATRGVSQGKAVTFAPLPRLVPKARATWKVVVKAVKEGDSRFKVSMTSDILERPVEETESTNLYK